MTDKKDIVAEAGLQFFSKASVSISHELKRTLATSSFLQTVAYL
jgi:hypothetical protein